MSLVHMGGRIYDPVLGRFLQADPMIQAPENIQSLNRYSYVMNNPLNATDPSGYIWVALVTWAVKALVANTVLAAAVNSILLAYQFYGYYQLAKGVLAASKGNLYTMGKFAGGMAKSYLKSMAENAALKGLVALGSNSKPTKGGGSGDNDLHKSTSVTGSGNSGGNGVAGLVSDNVFDNLSETEQDAVTTLLSHNSQQGRVNDSLGSFDSQREADIAAHNLYNPLSQIVKDEVQWFVVKTESGFQATFGAVGTLSGEGGSSTGVNPSLMYHRVKKSFGKVSIMRSGHTHWDSNNNFSGNDARHVTSMVKNGYVNKKYLVSVSTRNGSYRELNYRRAKSSVNIARPEGRLIKGVTIGE